MLNNESGIGQVYEILLGYFEGVTDTFIPSLSPTFIDSTSYYGSINIQLLRQEDDSIKFRINSETFIHSVSTTFTHVIYNFHQYNTLPFKVDNIKYLSNKTLEVTASFDARMFIVINPSLKLSGFREKTVDPTVAMTKVNSDQIMLEKNVFNFNGLFKDYVICFALAYSKDDLQKGVEPNSRARGGTADDLSGDYPSASGYVANYTDSTVISVGLTEAFTPGRIMTAIALSNYFDKCLDVWIEPKYNQRPSLGTISIDSDTSLTGLGIILFDIVDTRPKALISGDNAPQIDFPTVNSTNQDIYNREIVIRADGVINRYKFGDLMSDIYTDMTLSNPRVTLKAMYVPATSSEGSSIIFSYSTYTHTGVGDLGYILQTVNIPCYSLKPFYNKTVDFWKRNVNKNALTVITGIIQIIITALTGGSASAALGPNFAMSMFKLLGQAATLEATLSDYDLLPLQSSVTKGYTYKSVITVGITSNPLITTRDNNTLSSRLVFDQNMQKLLESPSSTALSYTDIKVSDFINSADYGSYGLIQGNFYPKYTDSTVYVDFLSGSKIQKMSNALKEGIRIGY